MSNPLYEGRILRASGCNGSYRVWRDMDYVTAGVPQVIWVVWYVLELRRYRACPV